LLAITENLGIATLEKNPAGLKSTIDLNNGDWVMAEKLAGMKDTSKGKIGYIPFFPDTRNLTPET
jgi:hypothetical protein